MAGNVKGEVSFKVEEGTLAGEYTLLLDFNALCDLEDTVPGLMDGTASMTKPSAIRAVFHGALARYHPNLTVAEAGEIIHALGVEPVANLLAVASDASFGKPEAAKGTPSPRKAPAKAGAGSGR